MKVSSAGPIQVGSAAILKCDTDTSVVKVVGWEWKTLGGNALFLVWASVHLGSSFCGRFFAADSRYTILPSGDLLLTTVTPEDKRVSFQCIGQEGSKNDFVSSPAVM